jgi:transcriptional regulator with XRE-family HTH domain
MDRVAILRRLRKSAGITLPEMAALLRVPVRSLTRGDAAALDRAAKKLLALRPARSRGRAGRNARAHR